MPLRRSSARVSLSSFDPWNLSVIALGCEENTSEDIVSITPHEIMQEEEYQTCHFHLCNTICASSTQRFPFWIIVQVSFATSIDPGHPHLAVADLQHPASHPGIALIELRQLGRLGEPKQDQQQIPDRLRLVSDKHKVLLP